MRYGREKKASFMTVKEFAYAKGVSVQAIYQKAKRGGLLIKKIGTWTLVAEKD